MISTEYLMKVALDVGTSYSGYAFSNRYKPNDISLNDVWVAGVGQMVSSKTPTCVLLDKEQTFVAFGYDAENRYDALVENDNHHGYYFFRRFKMTLYKNKDINKDLMIEDISGKRLPAMTVFAHSIRYLVDHFKKTIRVRGCDIKERDIEYVLTVPAIWSDKAKQFMRKSCTKAGIPSDQLRMALEPEAASVWCQTLTDQHDINLSATGEKYMVVDIGGGTADITVNEKMQDGTLEELHKSSGGPWGGTEVDKAYLDFLSGIFGKDVMKQFQQEQIGDFFSLMTNFEYKKRSVSNSSGEKVVFVIPVSLCEIFEMGGTKLVDSLRLHQFDGVELKSSNKLIVKESIIKGWFSVPIDKITTHVLQLLDQPLLRDVKKILLVGGFADCSLVQEAFLVKFGQKMIVPPNAGVAVLNGAVMLGHRPELISARKSKFTYGTNTCPRFNKTIHMRDKRIVMDGEERCNDVFSKIVSIGETLHHGREFKQERSARNVDQTEGTLNIYCSEEVNPKYVTDSGCTLIGTLKIKFPDAKKLEDKDVTLSLIFWDTEIRARVELKSGIVYEETFDSM